jgi:cytochrome c5
MKKVFLFAAMFVASAIMFTACGGGEATTTDDAAATEEVAADEATPAEEAPAEEAPAEETATVDIATLGDAAHGEEVYNQVCMACHATAVAGAAKLDDVARWEATAAKGFETVKGNTINGFTGENGVMPPKGGRTDLTDQDMVDAIAYMFQTAGVNF